MRILSILIYRLISVQMFVRNHALVLATFIQPCGSHRFSSIEVGLPRLFPDWDVSDLRSESPEYCYVQQVDW